MFAARNPDLLAALLRGEAPSPAFEQSTPPLTPRRGGLPRAAAAWQTQQAERDAEALRIATTPRAWVDGSELPLTVPSIETKATPDAEPIEAEPDTPPEGVTNAIQPVQHAA